MRKIVIATLMTLSLAHAGGLFSIGHKNFGINLGTTTAYGNDYTVLGANFNYFIQNNLSVGVGYLGYFGDDPAINQISFPATFYYPLSPVYYPYAGVFYKHTFIDDPYDDYDTYGFRVGLSMLLSSNSFLSAGWVQEYIDSDSYDDTDGRFEMGMGFTF